MAEPSLADQLEEIWIRHLPATTRQIDLIVEALRGMARDAGTTAGRELAGTEAHRLFGMAATYGRSRLADLARAAERLLRAAELSDEELAELGDVADQLEDISAT